ncbi:MAG TPA: hypothetical protein VD814_04870 [Nocardioides sp.]|nr:hypothetical protein [Nocardioides sp.]
MSTQYLSYGIVDGRTRSDEDLVLLRALELARESERRSRRTRSGLRRFAR